MEMYVRFEEKKKKIAISSANLAAMAQEEDQNEAVHRELVKTVEDGER